MNISDLRLTVERAFEQAKNKKMLSTELQDFLGFSTPEKRAYSWGALCSYMISNHIIKKCKDKPVKINGRHFYYYELIQHPLLVSKLQFEKDEFVIFNEHTPLYERATGDDDLNAVVKRLLNTSTTKLMIFKLVEIAQSETMIERKKIG